MKFVIKCRLHGQQEWSILTTCTTQQEAETKASRWIDSYGWPADTAIKVFQEDRP